MTLSAKKPPQNRVSLALTCKQHLSPTCGPPWRHQPCELVTSTQGHETAPLNDTEPRAALSVSLCSLLPRETGLSVLGSWSTLGHRTCLRHPTCPEPPHLPKAHLPQGTPPAEALYLLEVQACGAAFGRAEFPHTHHGAGPRSDDGRGGRAHGTQTAAPGGQVLERHQDLREIR